MFKKIIAAFALVFIAIFAGPVAAHAALYSPAPGTVSGDAVPGGTVTVSWEAGTFDGGEPVQVTVSGNGDVTVAVFKAGTSSTTKTAAASGALSATIHLPSDASGTYTVTATGADSGKVGTAGFTVGGAGSGTGSDNGSGAAGSGSDPGLADTGSTVSILAFWVGGGIVLLGAAFVAVRVVVRRQARSTNA